MSDQRYIAYADNRTFKVCGDLVEAMKWAVDIKGDVYLPLDLSRQVVEQQQEIERLRKELEMERNGVVRMAEKASLRILQHDNERFLSALHNIANRQVCRKCSIGINVCNCGNNAEWVAISDVATGIARAAVNAAVGLEPSGKSSGVVDLLRADIELLRAALAQAEEEIKELEDDVRVLDELCLRKSTRLEELEGD
jgi:cell division protein FtsB